MMAGWAGKGILNSPGYLVRKENHGSDFAEASSYAKASADKTADKTADKWARMMRGDLEISPQRHGEHRGRGSKSQGF